MTVASPGFLKLNGGVVSLTPTTSLPRAVTSSSRSAAAGAASTSSQAATAAIRRLMAILPIVPPKACHGVSIPGKHRRNPPEPENPGVARVNHSLGLTFYCSTLAGRPYSATAEREAMRRSHAHCTRLLAAVALALAAAGCSTTPSPDVTGSIATPTAPRTEAEWRREMDVWGQRYRSDPTDKDAAIKYAQALRGIGQRAQATAVLEQAAIQHPHDDILLGAYGRALADNGNYAQALEVLNRAHSPDRPDWRILSVQGAALDQLGRHGEAQRYYASALRLVPDEPSVLSNLGLSYALSKNLPQAETTLRRAAELRPADAKIRQNYALVVGLQGRFAEAEKIVRADLSADEAAQNVAYLRQMLAQQKDLKKLSRPGAPLAPSTGS